MRRPRRPVSRGENFGDLPGRGAAKSVAPIPIRCLAEVTSSLSGLVQYRRIEAPVLRWPIVMTAAPMAGTAGSSQNPFPSADARTCCVMPGCQPAPATAMTSEPEPPAPDADDVTRLPVLAAAGAASLGCVLRRSVISASVIVNVTLPAGARLDNEPDARGRDTDDRQSGHAGRPGWGTMTWSRRARSAVREVGVQHDPVHAVV